MYKFNIPAGALENITHIVYYYYYFVNECARYRNNIRHYRGQSSNVKTMFLTIFFFDL